MDLVQDTQESVVVEQPKVVNPLSINEMVELKGTREINLAYVEFKKAYDNYLKWYEEINRLFHQE